MPGSRRGRRGSPPGRGLIEVAAAVGLGEVVADEVAVDDLAQDVEPPVGVVDIQRGEIRTACRHAGGRGHLVVRLLPHEARIVPAVAQAERRHALDLLPLHELVQLDAERLLLRRRAPVAAVALEAHADYVELVLAPDQRGFAVRRVVRIRVVVGD